MSKNTKKKSIILLVGIALLPLFTIPVQATYKDIDASKNITIEGSISKPEPLIKTIYFKDNSTWSTAMANTSCTLVKDLNNVPNTQTNYSKLNYIVYDQLTNENVFSIDVDVNSYKGIVFNRMNPDSNTYWGPSTRVITFDELFANSNNTVNITSCNVDENNKYVNFIFEKFTSNYKTIYFQAKSWWHKDKATSTILFYKDGTYKSKYTMVNNNGLYSFTFDINNDTFNQVNFERMNPQCNEYWGAKTVKLEQVDLENYNLFTLQENAEWNNEATLTKGTK